MKKESFASFKFKSWTKLVLSVCRTHALITQSVRAFERNWFKSHLGQLSVANKCKTLQMRENDGINKTEFISDESEQRRIQNPVKYLSWSFFRE